MCCLGALVAATEVDPDEELEVFVSLLSLVGTPAEAPKPRVLPPGRPRESRTGPAKRYPAFKKAA